MIMWNAIHWKFIYIVTSQWNLIWLVKRERECNLNLWNRSHVICPFRLQSADLSVSLLLKDHEVQGDVLMTLKLLYNCWASIMWALLDLLLDLSSLNSFPNSPRMLHPSRTGGSLCQQWRGRRWEQTIVSTLLPLATAVGINVWPF